MMTPRPRAPRSITTPTLLAATVMLSVTVAAASRLARPSPLAAAPADSTAAADALAHFLGDDFGGLSRATLETNALPYKVVATALLQAEEARRGTRLTRADLPAVFARYGFLFPERVHGWPAGRARPGAERPLGLLARTVGGPVPGVRIEAATIGCASCHAGVLYDADGNATRTAWPGLPNTSLNLEAYVQATYRGLQRADADRGAFRRRVHALFPGMSLGERATLRYVLQRRIHERLAALRRAGDRPLPFLNGGAGRTNGVASLTQQVGLYAPGEDARDRAVGFTSTPALTGRALRTSLLYDGVYAPLDGPRFAERDTGMTDARHLRALADIVGFFTVPTMGVAPGVAEARLPDLRPVVSWLATAQAPPPFPGVVDTALAARGAAVYEARCAQCHGRYADGPRPRRLVWFPNRLVPQAEMGTDSTRWAMVDSALVARLNATAYGRHMSSARTGGYVAPILSGAWATAPYLHNGSVPTLWALLTPAARPVAFQTGGHRLDYRDVGIAGETGADGVRRYAPGYVPWSDPELYDTRRPGLSNRGHERQVRGLGDDERRAVVEYLKTL